jgi:hypothetical protein
MDAVDDHSSGVVVELKRKLLAVRSGFHQPHLVISEASDPHIPGTILLSRDQMQSQVCSHEAAVVGAGKLQACGIGV